MKLRSTLALVALLLGAFALSGCDFLYKIKEVPDTDPPVVTDDMLVVKIVGFKFEPQVIEIEVGQTVTWVQEDAAPHTVTSTAPLGVLGSGTMRQNEVYEFTFDTPGTYEYFCSIHPAMLGTVVVNEAS